MEWWQNFPDLLWCVLPSNITTTVTSAYRGECWPDGKEKFTGGMRDRFNHSKSDRKITYQTLLTHGLSSILQMTLTNIGSFFPS